MGTGNATTEMGPYVMYGRTSSDIQRERATIKAQVDTAERYCAFKNISVSEWYLDDGVNNEIPCAKRPAGSRLLADAKAGKFRTLLIFDYQRLGRDEVDTLATIRQLERLGIRIVAITQELPAAEEDDGSGSLMRTIFVGYGAYEKQRLRKRVISGHVQKASLGRWQGGKAPFGYRIGPDKKLEIDEDQASIVREIFALYLTGDCSTQGIADLLTARGVPHPLAWGTRARPRPWAGGTISLLLRNPIYLGRFTWRRLQIIKQEGKVIERRVTDDSKRITFPIPPLVTEKDFLRVQELLKEKCRLAPRNMSRVYLLRGLIKCGVCGAGYVGSSQRGHDGRRHVYYTCHSQSRGRTGTHCGNKPVRAEPLETDVWRQLLEWADRPQTVFEELRTRQQSETTYQETLERRRERITAAIESKTAERARVINLCRRGLISEHEAERELQHLRAEVDRLEIEQAALNKEQTKAQIIEDELAEVEAVLRSLREIDRSEDDQAKAKAIRRLVDRITIATVEDPPGKRKAQATTDYVFLRGQRDLLDYAEDGC